MEQDLNLLLPQGAIFEMVPQGAYVKVSAVDPVTRMEVSIVGDRAAGAEALKQIAIRKLARAVAKTRGEAPKGKQRREDPPSGWDL